MSIPITIMAPGKPVVGGRSVALGTCNPAQSHTLSYVISVTKQEYPLVLLRDAQRMLYRVYSRIEIGITVQ